MIDFKVGRWFLDPLLLKSPHWHQGSVVASVIFILQKCWLEKLNFLKVLVIKDQFIAEHWVFLIKHGVP